MLWHGPACGRGPRSSEEHWGLDLEEPNVGTWRWKRQTELEESDVIGDKKIWLIYLTCFPSIPPEKTLKRKKEQKSIKLLIIRRFCICELACSLTLISNPQVNTQDAFTVICAPARRVKNSSLLTLRRPMRLNKEGDNAFLFRLSPCKQASFSESMWWQVFLMFVLLLVILLFKVICNCNAECCLVFLSTRRLWRAVRRKYVCWMRVIQAWVTVLLARSSTLLNQ